MENNTRAFALWEFIQCLGYVGFPVYFTFYLQSLLLWTLWSNVPSFVTDENICNTSGFVQHAVISIFFIFLIPSVLSITRESLCILRCDRVAFRNESDNEKMVLYRMVNSEFKRILSYVLVVIPEICILITLCYVGSGFILTSESIGDIIINSVAIAFLMDIDNFCVEAFQSESVTERASEALFEVGWEVPEEKFTAGEISPLDPDIIKTFSNISKVLAVIIISGIYIAVVRAMYCNGSDSRSDDLSLTRF